MTVGVLRMLGAVKPTPPISKWSDGTNELFLQRLHAFCQSHVLVFTDYSFCNLLLARNCSSNFVSGFLRAIILSEVNPSEVYGCPLQSLLH